MGWGLVVGRWVGCWVGGWVRVVVGWRWSVVVGWCRSRRWSVLSSGWSSGWSPLVWVAGVPVGVVGGVGLAQVVAALAVVRLGAVWVPVDVELPVGRAVEMVADAGVTVAVVSEAARAWWAQVDAAAAVTAVVVDDGGDVVDVVAGTGARPRVLADDAAWVLFTSGTTGRPKGVIGSLDGLRNRLSWWWRTIPYQPGDRAVVKTRPGFVDAISELLAPLLAGIPVVVADTDQANDPGRLAALLADEHVTHLVAVPSLLAVLYDTHHDVTARAPLRVITSSGEPLSTTLAATIRRTHPHATIVNLYGSTETSGDATAAIITADQPIDHITIGRPIDNVAARILDRHHQLLPPGASGHLHIGGAALTHGYLPTVDSDDHARFWHDDDHRWYDTGDLARWTPDGTLEHLGRHDRQTKIRGVRVEPAGIEHTLLTLDHVTDAAVTTRHHPTRGTELTAYLVLDNPHHPLDHIRHQLRATLPTHHLPTHLIPTTHIPRTPTGKIDHHALTTTTAEHPEPTASSHATPPSRWSPRSSPTCSTSTTSAPSTTSSVSAVTRSSPHGRSQAVRRLRRRGLDRRPLQQPGRRRPRRVRCRHAWSAIRAETAMAERVLAAITRIAAATRPSRRRCRSPSSACGSSTSCSPAARSTTSASRPSCASAVDPRAFAPRAARRRRPPRGAAHRLRGPTTTNRCRSSATSPTCRSPPSTCAPYRRADVPTRRAELRPKFQSQPFDLRRGPLVRGHCSSGSTPPTTSSSSACTTSSRDGWSLGVLRSRDRGVLCRLRLGEGARTSHRCRSSTPTSPCGSTSPSGDVLETQLELLARAARATPPVLELPTDRPAPAGAGAPRRRGALHARRRLVDRLAALARGNGATLFMVTLAAFDAVLARWTGQDDLVVGVPSAGAPDPGGRAADRVLRQHPRAARRRQWPADVHRARAPRSRARRWRRTPTPTSPSSVSSRRCARHATCPATRSSRRSSSSSSRLRTRRRRAWIRRWSCRRRRRCSTCASISSHSTGRSSGVATTTPTCSSRRRSSACAGASSACSSRSSTTRHCRSPPTSSSTTPTTRRWGCWSGGWGGGW